MGTSTLCNACGLLYKRTGHLYAEYRPAESPTFVPALHSNFLKKVLETTKLKGCGKLREAEFMSNGSHLVEQDERELESPRVFREITEDCCNSDQLKDSPLDAQLGKDNNVRVNKHGGNRKSDSSKFVEYWVPVKLSNVQLEQYCATLLRNSTILRSCTKSVTVQALRDVLISNKKSCDHPYLVDSSLESMLTKGLSEVEYLDVLVNASGKLKVFDKMLSEIKKRGLRVLVLFQSISGSGNISIGDILDDFLCERFGEDSYERVDSGLLMSKKQAALSKFNDKERGRFVFLIESRACLSSIKLSFVDIVIIYDGNWNPSNDLRALQRITIESQYEQLKVFRLYSSCTLEEKILTLAKQNMTLDSNVQNILHTTTHMLLKWGAPYLFKELDEFHGSTTMSSASVISSEQSMLNVVQDLLDHLPQGQDAGSAKSNDSSIILKVKLTGEAYSTDTYLPGELEMQSSDDELPHVFWTKLLDRRSPQWRYLSGPSRRVVRKVKHFDESPNQMDFDIIKKRRKVTNRTTDAKSLKALQEDKKKVVSLNKEGASCTPAGTGSQLLQSSTAQTDGVGYQNINDICDIPEAQKVELEERRDLCESQKNLYILLKPEMSKLCEILRIPEDVKEEIGKIIIYITKKHHVNEQEAVSRVFQISLCWAAASFWKHKICHKESLALAKQHLNFEYKEDEAEFVYDAVQKMLKNFFIRRAKILMISCHGEAARTSIKLVRKIHNSRMKKLSRVMLQHHKFLKKKEEFLKIENAKLVEKGKLVDKEFQTKVKELNSMQMKKKKLRSMQQAAMNEEKRLKSHWLQEAKSGRPVDSYLELPLSYSGFRLLEDMDHSEQNGVPDGPKKATSISGLSSEEKITDRTGLHRPGEMPVVETRTTVQIESVEDAMPTEPPDVVMLLCGRPPF